MEQGIINYISDFLGEKIITTNSIAGGDISSAYKLETLSQSYFLKINAKEIALDMFKKEADGLKLISSTNSIATPKVFDVATVRDSAFILMEYVEPKSADAADMALFGKHLAQLHKNSSDSFGLDYPNYIGSLDQANHKHQSWADFYIQERLQPQVDLAKSKGRLNVDEIPSSSEMHQSLSNIFKGVKPSLLHGDLWSGNYIISSSGTPFLIDPAIYYGHSEVDIAMSQLFGGFGSAFYKSYHEIIAKDEFTPVRIEIYQLYYLLVHLNLFGNSYRASVMDILKKHF